MWKLNSEDKGETWEKETRAAGKEFEDKLMEILERLLGNTDPQTLKDDLQNNPRYMGIAIELLELVEKRLTHAAKMTLELGSSNKDVVNVLKVRVVMEVVKELVENADKYRS